MAERLIGDADEMDALGQALARVWRPPRVVGLAGPLGAGKTTLVRALLAGFGHDGAVPSPSYTLIESYPLTGMTVHHLDLYRLGDPEELELLGGRDLTTPDAVWLVEWPDRGGDRLPPLDDRLELDYADSGRRIRGLPRDVDIGLEL
jgi:tRNA threonylcarbamoyladenosine biosynthesis protein TsaE